MLKQYSFFTSFLILQSLFIATFAVDTGSDDLSSIFSNINNSAAKIKEAENEETRAWVNYNSTEIMCAKRNLSFAKYGTGIGVFASFCKYLAAFYKNGARSWKSIPKSGSIGLGVGLAAAQLHNSILINAAKKSTDTEMPATAATRDYYVAKLNYSIARLKNLELKQKSTR